MLKVLRVVYVVYIPCTHIVCIRKVSGAWYCHLLKFTVHFEYGYCYNTYFSEL